MRNQPLDLTSSSDQPSGKYSRSTSGKTPAEVSALRKKFEATRSTQKTVARFPFTPPVHDEEYAAAMEKLETL